MLAFRISSVRSGIYFKGYTPKLGAYDRTPITEIEMTFLKSVPQDTPVEMTMALDNSGSLHIIAEELQNHSKLDTTFQLSNQMSDEEMNSAALRMKTATIE